MQEAVTSSTKLLCPNGHGLQNAKRNEGLWSLSCKCTRGDSISTGAKTAISTPSSLKTRVEIKPSTTFEPGVEDEERAPQEESVGSTYVRPSAREAGEYSASLAGTI